MNIHASIWGSIVKMCNELIAEFRLENPSANIQFIDWEAHANIEELPDTAQDLIGPTSLVIMETSPEMFDINFAIAVSTYSTDENLFRLRAYISKIFERLRPLKKFIVYDSETAGTIGYVVATNGTGIMPMSRSTNRPFQYVQVAGLLGPGEEDS